MKLFKKRDGVDYYNLFRLAVAIGTAFCIAYFVLLIIWHKSFNISFGWGSFLGALVSGGATITVFLITTRESKRQFNILLQKEKPIFEFVKVKYYKQMLPFLGMDVFIPDMNIDFSSSPEFKDTETIECLIKNSGRSTVENISMACATGGNIVGKGFDLKSKSYFISKFLQPGAEKSFTIKVSIDRNITSFMFIIVTGTYANMEISEKHKIYYYPRIRWIIDRE